MRRMRWRTTRTIGVVVFAAAAVLGSASPARAPVNAAGTHWDSFRWGSFTHPIRYFIVYDRASDPAVSTATQQIVDALDALWGHFPGLPYPIYIADHANNGSCGSFNIPTASFMTVCSGGFPPGQVGTASWGLTGSNHFVNPWIIVKAGLDAATAYSAVCGMMGFALGLAENPQDDSCMKPVITEGQIVGFNGTDIIDLLTLYYSHWPN